MLNRNWLFAAFMMFPHGAMALDAACTTTPNLGMARCPEDSTDWYESYTDQIDELDGLSKTAKLSSFTVVGSLLVRSSASITGAAGLSTTYGMSAGSATLTAHLNASSATLTGTSAPFALTTSTGFHILAGQIYMEPGSSLRWPNGVISTAPAASGSGTGDAVLASSQIWSGGNTLYGSTTFYGHVFISTINTPAMSTTVYLASGLNTTQTTFIAALATATLTSYGEDLRLIANYTVTNSGVSNSRSLTFWIDGTSFPPGGSATVGMAKCYQTVSSGAGFGRTCRAEVRLKNVSAGTHTVALMSKVVGGTDTTEHTDALSTLEIERIR